VSVTVDTRLIDTGDDAFVDEAWELKERIRREEDVLKQRHGFFTDAYRRSKVHLLVEPRYDGEKEDVPVPSDGREPREVLLVAVDDDDADVRATVGVGEKALPLFEDALLFPDELFEFPGVLQVLVVSGTRFPHIDVYAHCVHVTTCKI